MIKHVLLTVLLFPSLVWADCGFMRMDDTMTIVVGRNAPPCASRAAFREAFVTDIKEALGSETAPLTRKARRPRQVARVQDHEDSKAGEVGGRYYGQR